MLSLAFLLGFWLVLAAVVPFVAVGLGMGSVLPLPVSRLLVGTNAVFVPLGVAWTALGYVVWSAADRSTTG